VDVQPVSAEVQYPPARNDRYEGRVEIPFKVRLPENEQGADFEIKVSYQACTESECLLPQEKRLNGVVFIA
jgi:DsbC/DsbD-like thiol-disulfide interchange protein